MPICPAQYALLFYSLQTRHCTYYSHSSIYSHFSIMLTCGFVFLRTSVLYPRLTIAFSCGFVLFSGSTCVNNSYRIFPAVLNHTRYIGNYYFVSNPCFISALAFDNFFPSHFQHNPWSATLTPLIIMRTFVRLILASYSRLKIVLKSADLRE